MKRMPWLMASLLLVTACSESPQPTSNTEQSATATTADDSETAIMDSELDLPPAKLDYSDNYRHNNTYSSADEYAYVNGGSTEVSPDAKHWKGLRPDSLLPIDLNQDLQALSLEELRLLRNGLYARQGYCFKGADLRGYFEATGWYQDLMYDRFWALESGDVYVSPIQLSSEEEAFAKRIKEREAVLLESQCREQEGVELPRLSHVVNRFQIENGSEAFWQKLDANGFVILPTNKEQLFHIYEENDYRQLPNFVTTDLYLQVYHMYFVYLLRHLEENQLSDIVADLSKELAEQANSELQASADQQDVADAAGYTATWAAVAQGLISASNPTFPKDWETLGRHELVAATAFKDQPSEFIPTSGADFPYSMFKPRGHYTRSDGLKRYFTTMMWLQKTHLCYEEASDLKRASFLAWLLHRDPALQEQYAAIFEPISFLIGQPDNVSIMDIVRFMDGSSKYEESSFLADADAMQAIADYLAKVAQHRNKISPKEANSCPAKINFMPQRYLADNEILEELVDVESQHTTKRAYPNGLDVFASFGTQAAEDILMKELKAGEKWPGYVDRLSELKAEFAAFPDWNASVYNKWIYMLLELQQPDKSYPGVMQTAAWSKKNLNTGLASWAELKHDAVLYAEQPMGAECGGGGPPDPVTVGYVEPNLRFWNASIELLQLTEQLLSRFDLMDDAAIAQHAGLLEHARFFRHISQKELAGKALTEGEYRTIEIIGSSFEFLTLGLLQDGGWADGWYQVKGPDRSVAVVADVYTANASNNPNQGVLHVANGAPHEIYVLVEIEGLLYITKGAVFSYYEFPMPMGTRLTDEEWQEKLQNGTQPQQPSWLKSIQLKEGDKPAVNEKIFYSSGC